MGRLSENKEYYRKLLDTIDDGFCIIKMLFGEHGDPVDYLFLETNHAFEEQTGIKNAEGKRMSQIGTDHEDYWFEIYGKFAKSREPVHFVRYANEFNRHFEVNAFPFGDPEDQTVAVLFKDITQRKEHEFKDAWLRAIIDSSEDAIVSKNLNGVITSWNASAERLFGYTEEEAVGQNITMIIPDDRLDEETEILDRIHRGERVEHFETVRKHKNGSKLDISLTISPIRNSRGVIVGASKIARDISKRKQAEEKLKKMNETLEYRVEKRTEELRAYQEQLRALASELSKAEERERHRLATELHNNMAQMLTVANMKLGSLKLSELPDKAAHEITDLSGVIDDVLAYTRDLITELKPPPFYDKENIGEVLDWVAKQMEHYDLTVTIENDNSPKPLSEEVRLTLYQCVRELLNNVVKHSGADEARVILSLSEGMIKIVVEDEGIGYKTEGKTPTPTKEGGFGLFNIRERINSLGGKFEIHSEPGNGTKAIIHAPLKEEENSDTHHKIKKRDKSTIPGQVEIGEQIRILLVDDHDMVRRGLKEMIESQDDMVIIAEAADGTEAVILARETKPDVILMDVNMPEMDGIEATKKINSDIPGICIIGLSLYESDRVAGDMRKAGASAYIRKTDAFEYLCATIRSEVRVTKQNGNPAIS